MPTNTYLINITTVALYVFLFLFKYIQFYRATLQQLPILLFLHVVFHAMSTFIQCYSNQYRSITMQSFNDYLMGDIAFDTYWYIAIYYGFAYNINYDCKFQTYVDVF